MRTIISGLAFTAALVLVPAIAQSAPTAPQTMPPGPSTVMQAPAPVQANPNSTDPGDDVICKKYPPVTGSLVGARKVCKKKKDWDREAFEASKDLQRMQEYTPTGTAAGQ